MFKLRYGYLVSGIITGCIILASFVSSIPDGKLHIYACDVGQGDGAYIKFPDGRDMVVDGGPNNLIINCLSKYMPFWDRHIDMVLMTHPQKDHFFGLIEVLKRYDVDYFVRSDVDNTTESYQELQKIVAEKKVPVKFMTSGEHITIGDATIRTIWPSQSQVLGRSTDPELNDFSLVFLLQYGVFDALFTGDADIRVENRYMTMPLGDIEVLKVPHHGSKTGMNEAFIQWVRPKLAIISVGKNSYGHPTKEALSLLESVGAQILRTDKEGDIEVVSDGKNWSIDK